MYVLVSQFSTLNYQEAERIAQKIASLSSPAVTMAKDAVNAAFEQNLKQGLAYERRLFYSLFATVPRPSTLTPNFTGT